MLAETMRNATFIIFTCLVCLGCGSGHYGLSETAWNDLPQNEREAIQAQALDRKLEMAEEHREKRFIYKPDNVYLGSRSNEYCPGCGLY